MKNSVHLNGTCLDGGMQSSERSDLPKQFDKKNEKVVGSQIADKDLRN